MLTDILCFLKQKLKNLLKSDDSRAKIQDADFIVDLLQTVGQAKGNFSLGDLHRSLCSKSSVFPTCSNYVSLVYSV